MVGGLKKILTAVASALALAAFSAFVPSSLAQQPSGTAKAQVVMGLTGVKDKTGGNLSVEGGSLHFSHEQTKVEVAAASIVDVVTGEDSQRVIHGSVGSTVLLAVGIFSRRLVAAASTVTLVRWPATAIWMPNSTGTVLRMDTSAVWGSKPSRDTRSR